MPPLSFGRCLKGMQQIRLVCDRFDYSGSGNFLELFLRLSVHASDICLGAERTNEIASSCKKMSIALIYISFNSVFAKIFFIICQ